MYISNNRIIIISYKRKNIYTVQENKLYKKIYLIIDKIENCKFGYFIQLSSMISMHFLSYFLRFPNL